MTITTPVEHVTDSQQLVADAYVDLFHIITTDGSHIYLKANNDATWQGDTYEGIGIRLTGVGQSADEEASRPQLQVANPMGIFSAFVVQKRLDNATVIRYRVLKTHLDSNANIFRQQSWRVTRVVNMDDTSLTVEMRGQLDGPNFVAPARMYMPPNFPTVSL